MFCKTFKSKRFEQIVLMQRHNDEGEAELRFYFKADGHGLCEFSIGFEKGDNLEGRVSEAFEVITPQDATQIIDGWLEFMHSSKELH